MIIFKSIIKKTLLLMLILLLFTSYSYSAEVHRVKSGDSLYKLAREYGITGSEIASLNHLENDEVIYKDQVLIIPEAEKSSIYRVKKGDTLSNISQQLKIPSYILAEANNLYNINNLSIRQPLYIPYRYRYPQHYTVKKGDTLYNIADIFNINTDEIIIVNNLQNTALTPGQSLNIPVLPKREGDSGYYKYPDYKSEFPQTFYRRGKSGQKKVALTFDDGPDSTFTPQVLDVLKKMGVQATFFLMGERAEKYPDIVKRIINEGHIIANHSYTHANLSKITKEKLEKEVLKTEESLEKITGDRTAFIRPPYGAYSSKLIEYLKENNYKVIHWSVDSQDWLARDVDRILINTLPAVHKDAIVLFHSAGGRNHSLAATVEVLPEFIRTLRMIGYNFTGLDKIISENKYK